MPRLANLVFSIIAVAGVCVPCLAQYGMDGAALVVASHTDELKRPRVSGLPTGEFVVVWQALGQDGDGWGIVGQRFGANGSPIGAQIAINDVATGDQEWPDVAIAPDGSFVAVWQSPGDADGLGVFARRFDAAGQALGASFVVSDVETEDQYMPGIAYGGGDFVIAWVDDPSQRAFARRLETDGSMPAGRIDVSGPSSGVAVNRPGVSVKSNGEFIVAWSVGSIKARRFGANDLPLGNAFTVASPSFSASEPEVDLAEDDTFVTSYRQDDHSEGQFYSMVQTTDALDQPISEVQADSYYSEWRDEPGVARSPRGDYLVAWAAGWPGEREYDVILAHRYSSPTGRSFGEFMIEVDPGNASHLATVSTSLRGDDDYVVVWANELANEIRAQFFCSTLLVADPLDLQACELTDAQFSAPATGRATISHGWRKDGVDLTDGGNVSGSATDQLQLSSITMADAGGYDVLVTDGCPDQQSDTTTTATLTVMPSPDAVTGLAAVKSIDESEMQFNWTDSADSDDYVVYEDPSAQGAFDTQVGTSSDGATGLTNPLTLGTRFYLVVGRNAMCGEGP